MSKKNYLSFQAEDKQLGDILFANSQYRIPRYQRPYAWTEDEASDFWNDLVTDSTSYFIGSFIFNYETFTEDNYIEVIDGQQRLLTVTIFMAVIRDIAKNIDNNLSERIQRKCISFDDLRGKETFRVLTGETTQLYFEKYIQNYNNKIHEWRPSSKEENKILKNYNFFSEKLSTRLTSHTNKEDKIEYLQNLWEKISNIRVIWIKIESEEDAYEIFETVNARGVDLTVADLLKNSIFKKINIEKTTKKDVAKNKWSQIEENIKQSNSEMAKFLRYHWLSKHSFITEKKLFKEIKKEIVDYKEFLNELHTDSLLYSKLLQGGRNDFKSLKSGHKIYNALLGIRLMGVSQCNVFFLSLLRNENNINQDLSRIFKLIERFTFIYSAISTLPGNKVEKIYSRYAIQIEKIVTENTKKNINKKIESLFKKLEKDLHELIPTETQFLVDFSEIRYKNTEKARLLIKYILSKIGYQYETGEKIIDFDNVNIEHVLPQSPEKEWHIKKSDAKEFVNYLGNLTLVHKKINAKIGNKNARQKVTELKKSEIIMTKDLANFIKNNKYKWEKKDIINRQKRLGKEAYNKIWKF